jgi:hypothetical protein
MKNGGPKYDSHSLNGFHSKRITVVGQYNAYCRLDKRKE